jgi:hypothetical protein
MQQRRKKEPDERIGCCNIVANIVMFVRAKGDEDIGVTEMGN